MSGVTAPETFIDESLSKVGRYYQVYGAFAFEAWINTSGGAVSASTVFKDPSGVTSLFDMDHSYNDVGGATLIRCDSTAVPLLAYPGAEHLELWDNLLLKYADGTLPGLPW